MLTMCGGSRAWTASRPLQRRRRTTTPTTAPVRCRPRPSPPPSRDPRWHVPFPAMSLPPTHPARFGCAGPAGSFRSRGSDISQQQSAHLDAQENASEKRVSLEVRRYDLSGGKDSPASSLRTTEDALLPAVPSTMSSTGGEGGEEMMGSMNSAHSDMVPAPPPVWLTMEKGPVPAPCRAKAAVVDDIIRGHMDNGEDPALGAPPWRP